MELKEGMYIRTKDKNNNQFIRKIIDMPKDTRYGSIVVDKDIHYVKWVSMKNILKASYNIIGLIEVGDYVNGYPVIEIDLENDEVAIDKIDDVQDWGATYIESDFIENVVTKEQFESTKYKVGD